MKSGMIYLRRPKPRSEKHHQILKPSPVFRRGFVVYNGTEQIPINGSDTIKAMAETFTTEKAQPKTGNETEGSNIEVMRAQEAFERSLTENNRKSASRQAVSDLASSLDIPIKEGAEKIQGTTMEQKAGKNLNPKVVDIEPLFEGVTDKNAVTFREAAKDLARRLFRDKNVKVLDTDTMAQINKRGIQKTFSGPLPASKIHTANKIGDIIKQGVYSYTTASPNDSNGILYHHFFTPVRFEGGEGLVRTVLKEYTKDPSVRDKYYYHQIEFLKNQKNSSPSKLPRRGESNPVDGKLYADIVSQNPENVNKENVSSFAKNTSTNEAFSEETRQALKNNPIEYQATTNEERLARANEILSSKSLSEVDSYLDQLYDNSTQLSN